jgi:hypothetical protein
VDPLESAPAVSFLAAWLISSGNVADNWKQNYPNDPETAKYEEQAETTEKLFRESGRILYGKDGLYGKVADEIPESYLINSPEANRSFLQFISFELRSINRELTQFGLDEISKEISLENLGQTLPAVERNLESLSDKIHERLWLELNNRPNGGYGEPEPLPEQGKKDLGFANGLFYRLLLVKDALTAKLAALGEVSIQEKSTDQPVKVEAKEQSEEELIREVIKDGGVIIYTSLPRQYHPDGGDGYKELSDGRRAPQYDPYFVRTAGHTFEPTLGYDSNVNEGVSITPMMKPGERGVASQKPAMHSEMVKGGLSDEQAFQLRYIVKGDFNHSYQDYSGRNGQLLYLEVIAPKTLADKLLKQIKSNPGFIRELAGQLVIKVLKIPEQAWNEGDKHTHGHPFKPPYEVWDHQPGGGEIYLQETDPNHPTKLVGSKLSAKSA